jgi:hypothetical protein
MSKLAAADLSAYQFCAMYISAANTVNLCNGFTHNPYGVLRNDPDTAGQAASIITSGECPVKLGENVVAGDRIRPGAAGTWFKAIAGWPAFGKMTEAGSTGEIRTANINCEGGHGYTISP